MIDDLTIHALSKLGSAGTRAAETALAPLGIRPRDLSTLSAIDQLGRGAQRQIAELVTIDPSDLVGVIDKLERAGLVSRERAAEDRRANVISLTNEGTKKLKAGLGAVASADAEFTAGLTKQERKQLSGLLGKMKADNRA